MTKLYNWVKSNAKKKKKNSGRIEYRDNKSAKFPRVPKNSILEGGGEKGGRQKKISKKKRSWSTMDPLKAAVAVGKTGNGLKACFPGASRSVWHSFHSWRAWSRLSKEPRARQTRQKERVKDSVAVSVILSLRHIHSSRFSFYIYVSTYNKYIHIQLYIYIYAVVRVLDAAAAVLRPSLSCSVLRFSSARSIARCSTPTQVYPPTHVHDYARKIDQSAYSKRLDAE